MVDLNKIYLLGCNYVPDGDTHWECYMQLLSIMVLVTAVEVTLDSVSELCWCRTTSVHLTPSIRTKSHLLHLPDQVRK
jgi:hypothetical protein